MVAKKKKAAAPKPPKFGKNTIRVRMYRVGFGDCFLLSLPIMNGAEGTETHKHLLIDCGVHARGDLKTIERAVDNIAETTGNKLAVVIATHSHQDHISGFSQRFSKFEIGEVWLPWCENPKDSKALKLQTKHNALTKRLGDHFAAEEKESRPNRIRRSAVAAIQNLTQNATALGLLRSGFGVNAEVRYLEAGGSLKNPAGIQGLSVSVLGPPRDQKFLAAMDPPANQRYFRLSGGQPKPLNELKPFADKWKMAHDELRPESRLSNGEDDENDNETKTFQDELASPSLDSLAFALDQAKNNTSLVTLLTYRGQQMLFPGDAQWGNWKFWLDQPDAETILSGVTFFKVAHHGSHNATPKSALERMSKGKFAAMVSTQNVPWDTIPRPPLMDALQIQTKNRAVRSDSLALASMPRAPKGPALDDMPKGFVLGEFWYDYLIKV
jgi:beta-lactamase superfamily II metal-dependent hydrolase